MPDARRKTSKKAGPRLTVVGEVKDRTTRKAREARVDFVTALRDKPMEEVMCRGMKHAWDIGSTFRLTNPATKRDMPIITVDLVCQRGGTDHPVRHETMLVKRIPGTKNEYKIVERLHASYTYPPGYQIKGVKRGVKSAADVWGEIVRRNAHVVHSEAPEAEAR